MKILLHLFGVVILVFVVIGVAGIVKFNIIGDDIYIEQTDGSVIQSNLLDKLTAGAWVESILGMEAEKQGFILHTDGRMESVNMATLEYTNWKYVDPNKLEFILVSHSNGGDFADSETVELISVTDTSLTIERDGQEYTYQLETDIAEATTPVTTMRQSWDGDGVNDCENDGSCDHTIDYTKPKSRPGQTSTNNKSDSDLNNSKWALKRIDDLVLETSNKITLELYDGKVHGNGGCNVYNSNYTVGDSNQISFTPAMQTMMACDPKELMENEALFHHKLSLVSSFSIVDDTLLLTTVDDSTMAFTKN